MARLNIPINQVANTGTSNPAQVTGVVVDGLELAPDLSDLVLVEVENTGTATGIATFLTPVEYDGVPVDDVALTLTAPAQAALTTALAGANNDLVFTAVDRGTLGNEITVTYVVAGLNTALSVVVTGLDIVVNVATDGAGAATSTAAQVETAVEASTAAAALVTVANAAANDGTGVVTALAQTALSGGDRSVKWQKLHRTETFRQSDGKVYVNVDVATLKFRAFRF